jgi:hypothetical protein
MIRACAGLTGRTRRRKGENMGNTEFLGIFSGSAAVMNVKAEPSFSRAPDSGGFRIIISTEARPERGKT